MHNPARVSAASAGAALVAHFALIIFAWGTNYPLMKLALQDISPLTFSAARLLGGAVVIAAIAGWAGERSLQPVAGERLRLALSGIFQYGGVLAIAAFGLQLLPAGRAVVAVYSMPLWAALMGLAIGRDVLTMRQWIGILVGAVGLSLVLNPNALGARGGVGALLVLAAAVSWALGAVIHRYRAITTPFLTQAFYQLMASAAVITVLAVTFESDATLRVTPSLTIVMIWNWLVPTSLAVWSWSRVLQRMPASTAGQVLMVTPLVGMATGAVMFDEAIPPIFLASAGAVLVGTLLVLPRAATVRFR